jgi:hypothetical protein
VHIGKKGWLRKRPAIVIVWGATALFALTVPASLYLKAIPQGHLVVSLIAAAWTLLVLVCAIQASLSARAAYHIGQNRESGRQVFEMTGLDGWIGAECRPGIPPLSADEIQGFYSQFVAWQDKRLRTESVPA